MKYHPIQFNSNLSYQEASPSQELKNEIAFYWELHTSQTNLNYQIIPDGCVDIIFNCFQKEIFICPTIIKPISFDLFKDEKWFGIRFYPGRLAGLLQVKLSALQFETIALKEVNKKLARQLINILSPTSTFSHRVKSVNQFFIKKSFETNTKIAESLKIIYETKGGLLLKENFNNNSFTIGERQLRRLFHQEIGVSPKSFVRIVRNQFLLNELMKTQYSKTYYDSYFDQSHMIKEMKKLTGFTPKQVLAQLF